MNNSSLSLGNLIYRQEIIVDKYLSHPEKMVTVESLYLDPLTGELLINGHHHQFYQGIIISPKWLQEMGFHLDNYGDWYENSNYSGLQISWSDSGNWLINGIPIYYLHQLQNIYYLKYKQELVINNK